MALGTRRPQRRDALVLALILGEMRLALRATRRSDLAWIVIGGGLLLSYGAGIAVGDVRAGAAALRHATALWWLGVPAAACLVGAAAGSGLGGVAAARAGAPFLVALPLSTADRRRMAWLAVLPFGLLVCATMAAVPAALDLLAGGPAPAVIALLAAAGSGAGVSGAASARILTARRGSGTAHHTAATGGVALGFVDRAGLAWVGSWACGAAGGRLRATGRGLAWGIPVVAVSVLAAGASIARREAGPAVAAGIAAGLASFMLASRFRPLASPVLRTAPLGFARAWLRLMRLPALLSGAVFLVSAGAALAAEPSAWGAPVSGALWLGGLNLAYAVFAATFLASPLLAAVSFAASLGYAAYESLEYGSAVYLAVVALLALLWGRARRRFRHG